MKEALTFEKAKEILDAQGYVRVGDHSATSLADLEDIFDSRMDAWAGRLKGSALPVASMAEASFSPGVLSGLQAQIDELVLGSKAKDDQIEALMERLDSEGGSEEAEQVLSGLQTQIDELKAAGQKKDKQIEELMRRLKADTAKPEKGGK